MHNLKKSWLLRQSRKSIFWKFIVLEYLRLVYTSENMATACPQQSPTEIYPQLPHA